jgi:NAD(P)-dependent dehydrogenase (short-subunit alcohol dehydrogenase family)
MTNMSTVFGETPGTSVFGPTSTTEDVLTGIDLQGKRILVTGVSAGLGVETARSLAAHGALVIGAARDLKKAAAATALVRKESAAKGGSFELVELDLANLKSVRACADHLLERGKPFDVVIANAGVMATPSAVRLTASRLSSAPITWATLSWSTGLFLFSVQVGG